MLGFIRFLILDCNDVELLKVIYFVRVLLNIVFLIIPIIAIVMLSLDLLKNVISNRDDDMRKNLSIFFKRIIYLVAIFLVYTIVNFSMNLVGANDFGASTSWLTCWNRSNPVSPYKGILSDD